MSRRLRGTCESMADGLNIPDPFHLEAFCASIGQTRRRHIMQVPHTFGDCGVTGVWVATPSVDYVFFEKNTPRPHQEHIILHEVGHLLWDHPAAEPGASADLFTDLDPSMVERVLHRAHRYEVRQEREAETLATVILRRIRMQQGRPADGNAQPDPTGILARITSTLG